MDNGYPNDWDSRRKRVYKRDSYICQNCRTKGGKKGNSKLHAHHIVPKSQGGTHKLTNLKTLCEECHDAAHGNKMAPSATSKSQKPLSLANIELLKKCPICADKRVETSIDEREFRCENCRTIIKEDGIEWRVTSSKHDVVGYSMSYVIWKRLAVEGLEEPSELAEYSKLSNDFNASLNTTVYAIAGFQLIVLIIGILSSNVLWSMGIILISMMIGFALTKHLDQDIRRVN